MNVSTASARSLVRGLLRSGVRDVVLSPGSRSAPLVYAFAEAAEASAGDSVRLHLHVRIDERDAAFTALGIAKAGRIVGVHRPVAVVTTSGSAVGNLHPAVMEAAHAHLPLVLITADRPARLRGTGANQTLDAQHQALPEVAAAWDLPVPADVSVSGVGSWESAAEAAVATALTSPPRPVQLNPQFDAPLVPDVLVPDVGVEDGLVEGSAAAWWGDALQADAALRSVAGAAGDDASSEVAGASSEVEAAWAVLADPEARPVIVAGDDLGFSSRALAQRAEEHAVPIFAEPSSALASHPCTIPVHAQVLGSAAAAHALARITHVIVTGRPTLSRPIAQLLADPRVTRIDVPYDAGGLEAGSLEGGLASGASFETASGTSEATSAEGATPWWQEWHDLAVAEGRVEPADAVLLELLKRSGIVVAASSNTIRHLARLQRPHHPARIVASRGLAGIDGLVATASGIALGLEDAAHSLGEGAPELPVRLVIGDLAALHDLGGFVVPTHERRPQLQIIVLNDDGGAIFAGLEHSQPHVSRHFDRFFGTPHGIGIAAAASALGLPAESIWAHDSDISARTRSFLDSRTPGLLEILLPPVTQGEADPD